MPKKDKSEELKETRVATQTVVRIQFLRTCIYFQPTLMWRTFAFDILVQNFPPVSGVAKIFLRFLFFERRYAHFSDRSPGR
jgi:hypothetical protein